MGTTTAAIVIALLTHNVPYVCVQANTTVEATGICTAEPERPGSGLNEAGQGLVHIMQSGWYTFDGAVVGNMQPGKAHYWAAGKYVNVQAVSSKLSWTRPGGVYEVIPRTSLYPPYSRIQ